MSFLKIQIVCGVWTQATPAFRMYGNFIYTNTYMYFYIYKYVYVFLQMLLLCRAGSLYQKLCNYLWGQAAPKEDSEDDLPNCSFASIVYLLPQMATNFGSFFTLLSRFCCCCNFTIFKQFLSTWVKVFDDDSPNCSFWPLC